MRGFRPQSRPVHDDAVFVQVSGRDRSERVFRDPSRRCRPRLWATRAPLARWRTGFRPTPE